MVQKQEINDGKISLQFHCFGLEAQHRWDREIICDYIAEKFSLLQEEISEVKKSFCPGAVRAAQDSHFICEALRANRAKGMQSLCTLKVRGIAGFVQWTKDELFQAVIREIREFAVDFRKIESLQRETMDEIINLTTCVLLQEDNEWLCRIEQFEEEMRAMLKTRPVQQTNAA